MSYLRQYCRIERRHMARAVLHGLLAAALVVVLVTFLLYGVNTAVQKRADREKITAAMVFPVNDQGKTLRELSEIIQNQKSINNFCNFVYLPEEEALSDLQNGTVQAVIVFGETFLFDVMTGVNSPAVVYLPEDAALDTQEFRELVQDGVSLIGTGEAGIYSGEQLADVLTLRVELSALDDVLTERFAMEALSRGSRFASEYVSAFGEEEPEQYYAASLLSVLLLMMGLLFSGLYGEQDRNVRKCLRRLDIGVVKTGSVRVLFMSLALWITAAAAVLVFSLFTGIIGRGTGALPDLLLYRIFHLTFGGLSVAVVLVLAPFFIAVGTAYSTGMVFYLNNNEPFFPEHDHIYLGAVLLVLDRAVEEDIVLILVPSGDLFKRFFSLDAGKKHIISASEDKVSESAENNSSRGDISADIVAETSGTVRVICCGTHIVHCEQNEQYSRQGTEYDLHHKQRAYFELVGISAFVDLHYTLNLNRTTSPSCITYSLPSSLTSPFSLAPVIPPHLTRSSNETTSALMKPFSKSVCIFPAAWGAFVPLVMVHARTSWGPAVRNEMSPSRE